LVAAWLEKAQEDLAVARLLIREEKRLLGAGVYHCQQAGEKALKAWLTSSSILFPKTHDLEVLLNLGAGGSPGRPGELEIAARELTPLATIF
jgi:HEPN domain-containing protein